MADKDPAPLAQEAVVIRLVRDNGTTPRVDKQHRTKEIDAPHSPGVPVADRARFLEVLPGQLRVDLSAVTHSKYRSAQQVDGTNGE